MHVTKTAHVPVLLEEVSKIFIGFKCSRLIDATLGGGGHSNGLLSAMAETTVCALDRDAYAVQRSHWLRTKFGDRFRVYHAPFSELAKTCTKVPYDGVLFDLGISSDQIAEKARGFSFYTDGPLDMRMDREFTKITAFDIINWSSEEELCKLFAEYGDEPYSRAIARAICRRRKVTSINTTKELADLVMETVPGFNHRSGKAYKHPATRAFQAIRIKVNEEITELEKGLPAAYAVLKPGGVLAAISFHALEDRIIKKMFQSVGARQTLVYPGAQEVESNARARSAKLRYIVK